MKRSEFVENCETYWDVGDLIQVAYELDLDSVTEDIYSEDGMNDMIDEMIPNCNLNWRELRDELAEIDTGYDYYWNDGNSYFGFYPVTGDDFDTIRDRIEDAMRDCWDSEDDEDQDAFSDNEQYDYSQGNESCDDDIELEAPEFDAGKLFDTCSGVLQTICARQQCMRAAEEDEFRNKINSIEIELPF